MVRFVLYILQSNMNIWTQIFCLFIFMISVHSRTRITLQFFFEFMPYALIFFYLPVHNLNSNDRTKKLKLIWELQTVNQPFSWEITVRESNLHTLLIIFVDVCNTYGRECSKRYFIEPWSLQRQGPQRPLHYEHQVRPHHLTRIPERSVPASIAHRIDL